MAVSSQQNGGEIALVHDYLLVMRGAERSFEAIAGIWPEAPIYTLLYDAAGTDNRFAGRKVRTSRLQALGARQNRFRLLLPLFPHATRHLDVSGFEVVVSSSSAFAHGVKKAPGAVHVCYCYTPFRYAWYERERALAEAPRFVRPVLGRTLSSIARWDLRAAAGVDRYIAISKLAQERIADVYGRDSEIIHPPVEVSRFEVGEAEDYFLFVGEVTRHKRVDVALDAVAKAGARMIVVGDGPDRARLEATFGDRAEFAGRVTDEELARLYRGALALIVPNVEEFGIAAVEAQAAGRPVVALARGGALETVVDGLTGVLVDGEEPDGFAEVLRHTDFRGFDPVAIAAHAQRFSTPVFQERVAAAVAAARAGGRA